MDANYILNDFFPLLLRDEAMEIDENKLKYLK